MQITIILSAISLGITALIIYNRHQFGASKKPHIHQHSSQYSHHRSRFVNEHQYKVALPKVEMPNALWRFIVGKNKKPSYALPEVKPDLTAFLQETSDMQFIWLGHSTFMLNFAGKILLFDPVFSKAASPFAFVTKRFQKPVLSLEELPKVDYIVLSHDHYDHLDMHTIKFFKHTQTKFLTPLGVGAHLQHWGIAQNRITELDWWQSINYDGLEFILTPAQHFSGRKLLDYNHTLWGSWIVRNVEHSIFFSGDSGYAKHFQVIGDKYGPFDLVFIENGQYDQSWRDVHMLPVDVIQAVADLKAKRFVPIHWGMFCLAPHQWFDPIESIYNLAAERKISLYTPKLGQMIILDKTQTQPWWRELVVNVDFNKGNGQSKQVQIARKSSISAG